MLRVSPSIGGSLCNQSSPNTASRQHERLHWRHLFLVFPAPIFSDGQFVQVKDSPVSCSSEGVECDNSGDNLIDGVEHVMTVDECLDQDSCQFITYFDDSAAPFSHFCQLHSSCDTVNNCTNCVSENMACDRSCSDNVVGDLDENIVDSLPNTDSETDCKRFCQNTTGCSHYNNSSTTNNKHQRRVQHHGGGGGAED